MKSGAGLNDKRCYPEHLFHHELPSSRRLVVNPKSHGGSLPPAPDENDPQLV
jgi:hypothetical protein